MFKKLKDKFKNWLFREELCRLEYLEKAFEKSNNELFIAKAQHAKSTRHLKEATKTCEQLRDVCTPLLDIGTDIGFYEDHSWAVVCIKGKPEYVKFIPMDGYNAKQLLDFLKQYEKSNKVVDSPLAFRGMLDRKMFI